MKLKERFRTMLPILADDQGNLPSQIQIMPLGVWKSPTHGDFSIQASDAQQFIDNFKGGRFRAGDSLPIDLDHDGGKAAGWITNLSLKTSDEDPKANGLWADVEWTPIGAEAIRDKIYKFFSPEFAPTYMAAQDGSTAKNVLIGGGLVNRPFFKDMVPVKASEDGAAEGGERPESILFVESTQAMDIKKLLAKKAGELTQDERAFLKAHEAELTEEQRTEYLKADDQAGDAEPETGEEPGTEEDKGAAEGLNTSPPELPAQPQDSTTMSEKTVTMTAAEKTAFDERIKAGEKAMSELRTMKMGEQVRGWLFSDKGTGKFAPAVKDQLQELALTFSDRQMALWEKLVAAMPDVRLFTELGSAEAVPVNAGEALERIASAKFEEAKKAGSTLQYSEFFKQAASEHPDLAKRYAEESRQASN